MGCLTKWLDFTKRRVKRVLSRQNYLDKFYPHSVLTLFLQLGIAYEAEIEKFARVWCNPDLDLLVNEVTAIKEMFEVENNDNMTWMTELLSNKYAVESENIDRLIYVVHTVRVKR